MPAAPANPTASPAAARSKDLTADLWGGFAAMLVALPSSIAYGIAIYALLGADYVGYGVRAGILGAIAMGLVAPLLGGAPRLISAPCAPAAAVLAALAGELLAGTHGAGGPVAPERIVVLLTLVALLSGALQFLYGAAGGGRLIKYIPYPVVSGYLSGVGVIIFLSQVPKFLGLPKGVPTWTGVVSPHLWQWPALIVGGVTIAGVLLAPKVTKAVPATILGLLCGLAAYFGVAWFQPALLDVAHNKLVIGPVGGGAGLVFSEFAGRCSAVTALHFSDLGAVLVPALTLSVLLSVDTLKTCVVVDALTRSRHDSNRELIGQGAGNLASALIGGMPGAGTMGATLVNVQSGGRTRLSGVIEGVCVLAAFLVFGNLIAWVPIGALAGILFVVAFRMFDWGSFALLRQRTTALDFCVIAAVIVVAVGVNLIAAAGTGLGLAILLFIREQIHGSVIRRKMSGDKIYSKQHRLPAEQAVLEQHGALTTVCELQGSLFFGTTDQLFTELEPDLKRCRHLILDMRRVQSVDFSAAHLLERFESMLTDRGGYLIFSRLPATLPTGQNLTEYFDRVGVTRTQGNVRKFDTLDDALQWVEDRILAAELPRPAAEDRPLALAEIELLREFEADQTLAALASCVVERSCAAGQTIFKGGEVGDELFLIRRGVVRIVLPLQGGNYHNLAAFGPGNFFGEVAFLDRGIRSANAVATTDTDLFVISRARFNEMSHEHPLLGVKVFARLARALALRLRRTDGELRTLYEA
jgi:SulP family sulfate permease